MDRYLKKKIGLLEKKKRLKNHWKIDDILLIYWKYITNLLTIFLARLLPFSLSLSLPPHTHRHPLTRDIFTKISAFYQYIAEISLISLIFCSIDNRCPLIVWYLFAWYDCLLHDNPFSCMIVWLLVFVYYLTLDLRFFGCIHIFHYAL